MKITREGAEIATRALEYIETHPDEWNQAQWHCGTQFCFAGHIALQAGAKLGVTTGNDPFNDLVVLPDRYAKGYSGHVFEWHSVREGRAVTDIEDLATYILTGTSDHKDKGDSSIHSALFFGDLTLEQIKANLAELVE